MKIHAIKYKDACFSPFARQPKQMRYNNHHFGEFSSHFVSKKEMVIIMLCEKCKQREATTHIRTVVNGIAREYNLCSKCAAEHGYADVYNKSLAGILMSMLGENTERISSEKQCPMCKTTFSDIAKSGKLGCSECYKTFEAELLPYLKRIHGSVHHIGKIPNKAPLVVVEKEQTVDSLRNELSRLVAEERYEEAAVLRDKIKKMEGTDNE